MADYVDELVADFAKAVDSAPISEPVGDEYVDHCAYSRTGWAVWRRANHDSTHNYCTCRPANSPHVREPGQ